MFVVKKIINQRNNAPEAEKTSFEVNMKAVKGSLVNVSYEGMKNIDSYLVPTHILAEDVDTKNIVKTYAIVTRLECGMIVEAPYVEDPNDIFNEESLGIACDEDGVAIGFDMSGGSMFYLYDKNGATKPGDKILAIYNVDKSHFI